MKSGKSRISEIVWEFFLEIPIAKKAVKTASCFSQKNGSWKISLKFYLYKLKMEFEMISKKEILEYIADRSKKENFTDFEDVAEEFDLEAGGACVHLKRLWLERLIRARGSRPPKYRYRFQWGESIRDLRFRLTSRGQDRLDWFEEQEEEEFW